MYCEQADHFADTMRQGQIGIELIVQVCVLHRLILFQEESIEKQGTKIISAVNYHSDSEITV